MESQATMTSYLCRVNNESLNDFSIITAAQRLRIRATVHPACSFFRMDTCRRNNRLENFHWSIFALSLSRPSCRLNNRKSLIISILTRHIRVFTKTGEYPSPQSSFKHNRAGSTSGRGAQGGARCIFACVTAMRQADIPRF